MYFVIFFFFFKQKTAYEMRISDWSSDVCSSDLGVASRFDNQLKYVQEVIGLKPGAKTFAAMNVLMLPTQTLFICDTHVNEDPDAEQIADMTIPAAREILRFGVRSEAHTSELPSLMRISYAVFCLKKKHNHA